MNACLSGGVLMKFCAVVVSCCFAVSMTSCQNKIRKERTLGYKGEARKNAFLAAKRLLEQRGEQVEFKTSIGNLDEQTATLFLTPSSVNTVGRSKRILEWVNEGGHLVVMVTSGEKRGNDFQEKYESNWYFGDEGTPGLNYLLEQLEVELIDWEHESEVPYPASLDTDDWEAMAEEDRALLGAEKTEFSLGGDTMEIYHWADKGLQYDSRFDHEYGTGKGQGKDDHRFLCLYYGDGTVTLLADASPLRNRFIRYGDHARLLTELMAFSRDGTTIFTDGGGQNFFVMVWRYFWMAVVGLGLMIVFWLWKNLPRYGPPQDLPKSEVREFSGQVRGIGRFLWRHKRDDAMLGSLRGRVLRKLSLSADGQHEGVFDQLAERTGLPLETITEAMTRINVREPGVMVRIVKNLQHILKTINQA